MKKKRIIILKCVIIIFFLFSCYTTIDISERLTKINENINIALKMTFYLRTSEIEVENLYIQNLRTFEIYKFIPAENKYFYINNIPAGQYRFGFFIATYKVNRIEFKILSYTNFIFNLSKSGNYFLGNFFYQYAVNSNKISPIKIEIKDIKNIKPDFENYILIDPIRSMAIEKTNIYKNCEYGNVYLINISNDNIEKELIDLITREKSIIEGYFKIIDREFNKNGIDKSLLDLILGYYVISGNINLLIKKALLYYNLNKIEDALKIFEDIKNIDPNVPEYYSILGEIEFNKENYEKAKLFLYRAMSNNTLIIKSYDLYAKILIKESDYKNAKIFSDYSLQKERDNIEYIKTNLEIHKKLDDKKTINKLEKRYLELKNGR
ncbi:MAG TPA: hypothetical protein PLE45_05785 [Spirochaetota bacterium]|nr:hypothetical protein [Spirochaetota bacterium]HOL56792.1 hypothetical protein [Spirochaetota bacterium]HPP04259.1 hypothetical protein [Spirochaetota bacterium]